jgi:sugar/nucleoside kinase (ribokinase family)
VLAALGDLVEDVVVLLDGPIAVGSDTVSRISRRRGGSAANVAAATAGLGVGARFLGQVGDDAVGRALVAELAAQGVDVSRVRHAGATGTIVALVDPSGERSMLTDRRTCVDLGEAGGDWLDSVEVLHVPFYSLAAGPIAATASSLIERAHSCGVAVSIDTSSTAVLEAAGPDAVRELLERRRPSVILANRDEAAVLGIDGPVAGATTVVKRGPDPATVHVPGARRIDVASPALGDVGDTTGAGDAFAAGFLTGPWREDPVAAVERGHRAAAALLRSRGDR